MFSLSENNTRIFSRIFSIGIYSIISFAVRLGTCAFYKGYLWLPELTLFLLGTHFPRWKHQLQPKLPFNCMMPYIGDLAPESTLQTSGYTFITNSSPFRLNSIISFDSLFMFSTKGSRKTFMSGLFFPNHNPTTMSSVVLTWNFNCWISKKIDQIE